MKMKKVPLVDELFQGAVSLEKTEEGVKPWRIPYADYELFPPNGIGGKAEQAAGVRLCFASDTAEVELHLLPSDANRQFDCVVDGQLMGTETLAAGEKTVVFRGLPPEDKTIELYLSQSHAVTVTGLYIGEGATFEIPPVDRPRWITYGSSITQCAAAASPAQTWPALVARGQRLHLTCLGYSGNCSIEPMVARMIRDLPADFISLCLGINIYGQNSYNMRTFRPAVIGFIEIVREKHGDIPLVVMSPIYCQPREVTENKVGLTLVQIREEIAAAVQSLQNRGDRNLHYISGLDIFGPEYAHHLPDQLHPDADGYRIMAENFQKRVMPIVQIQNRAGAR